MAAPTPPTLPPHILKRIGEIIAHGLYAQAARTPAEAAEAAGAFTPEQATAWIAEHRPDG